MSNASKSNKSSTGTGKTKKGVPSIPESVKDGINAIAKGIGVAATELWTIFVRQYVVKGLSELFTAAILYGSAFFLSGVIGLWALIPAGFGVAFTYGAIAYLGNPKYYALADITKRIQDFKDSSTQKSSRSTYMGY